MYKSGGSIVYPNKNQGALDLLSQGDLYFRLSALQRYLFIHSLSLIKNSFFRIDKSRKIRNLYAFPALCLHMLSIILFVS